MKHFHYKQAFELENGGTLKELTIAYSTYGTLNAERNNVIWICHALTANSKAADWWPGMIGEGLAFDTTKHFIVCANILGSCYGTTGPLSINPDTNAPYYKDFPFITIRDMVKAHQLLATHLSVNKIDLLVGGSMGGYQALEWVVMQPSFIDKMFLITTSAHESPWGIAIHTTQRLAIEADATWGEPSDKAGQKGLKAARGIGMITYRHYKTYALTQKETDQNKLDKFKASSYIEHQGNKLVNRYNAYSYWILTKAMDSHNIARGRSESMEEVLKTIVQRTLVIGIATDILCPPQELTYIANNIPNSTYVEIDSVYGHDGFLVEVETISKCLRDWMVKLT
jgi:homoserine O-acetyltransferase/O-succinyltransferase